MARRLYSITLFHSERKQKIKMHDPSIMQIVSGSKFISWKNTTFEMSKSYLLLCEAFELISFDHDGRFISRVFSFYCLPYQSMIEISKHNAKKNENILIIKDEILTNVLNALFVFNERDASYEIKRFVLFALYQRLAERGILHYLFASSSMTLKKRLENYLRYNPSEDHTLLSSAKYFAMSRATMIRKLKQEGTKFSDVLINVRLDYALILINNGHENLSIIAQLCGYESVKRFRQRFLDKFGMLPNDYIKENINK